MEAGATPVRQRDVSETSRTVVLLHAAGRGPGMWAAQMAGLSADFTVVAPSLGDTDPEADFSIPAAAERLAGTIDRRVDGPALVCGVSLGAFVALQLAVDHPGRVGGLVLSGGQAAPARALLTVNHALLRLMPTRAVVLDGGSRHALLRSYRSLFGWNLRERLGQVEAPTLVLCGGRDRANLPAARELADGIRGARLEVVPGAGHLWNLSDPDRFTAIVGGFFRGLGQRPGREPGPGSSGSPPDGVPPP